MIPVCCRPRRLVSLKRDTSGWVIALLLTCGLLGGACTRLGFAPVDEDSATRGDGRIREASAPTDAKAVDFGPLDLPGDHGIDLTGDLPVDPPGDLPVDLKKPPSTNLLTNGGCELGGSKSVVGWTAASCASTWSCANKPNYINPPQAGNLLFFAGPCTPAELFQIVDVSSLAPWIDQGTQQFSFSGWVSTWQSQKDSTQLIVEYRSSTGATLSAFDAGPLAVSLPWKQVSDVRAAPPGTRSIRVRIIAVRAEGTENDGYSDSLSLLALP